MGSHRPGHSTRASIARSALPTAQTNPSHFSPHLREGIREVAQQFRLLYRIVVTAELAMRTRNCDADNTLAACLRWGVLDSVGHQIERLSGLLVQLGGDAARLP